MLFKNENASLTKLVSVLLILSVVVLTLSILLESRDGRRQILDGDGGTEEQLCAILSSIEGAGKVEVMVEYDERSQVQGVIVLADGGSDPIVANNLTNGVATLYQIPVSSVIVFAKTEGINQGE